MALRPLFHPKTSQTRLVVQFSTLELWGVHGTGGGCTKLSPQSPKPWGLGSFLPRGAQQTKLAYSAGSDRLGQEGKERPTRLGPQGRIWGGTEFFNSGRALEGGRGSLVAPEQV